MDGITKFIHVAARQQDGSRTVQLLHPATLEKTASLVHPLIKQAAADLPPRQDGIWVLVNAVSAGEYWGPNTNGDFFSEESLKFACDLSLICPRERDYGHKTFEKYAFPYRHHVNKDTGKSVGERVKLAIWNDDMKRVELIHFLRRDSEFDEFGDIIKVGAPDLVKEIEDGSEVSVSMGCKVAYDICSKCANKAKNISLYCDHLKYAMSQVLPDGSQIYALNPFPRFFDLSYVLRGAEKTAKVLKNLSLNAKEVMKTASNTTYFFVAEGLEKAASENRGYCLPSAYFAEMLKSASLQAKSAVDKSGEIKKKVTSGPAKITGSGDFAIPLLRSLEQPLPDKMLTRLASYALTEACSTMAGMGMKLHPAEMKRIIIIKIQGGARPDDIGAPKIDPQHIRLSLAQLLKSQSEKRSSFREPLRRRVRELLNYDGQQLLDKVAANDKAMQGLDQMGEVDTGLIDKAAPLAALAAALYVLYSKNIKKMPIPGFMEKAFRAVPELPAAVVGAGIGGAFGLAGQSLIQEFGAGISKEASRKGVATAAGIFAAPYLYSGYVQQKALKGERIGQTEAAAARHPGVLGAAGLAGYLHRGYLRAHARNIAKKVKGLVKKGDAIISEEDILSYASDISVVDHAIAAGLVKIAARIVEASTEPAYGGA